MNTNKLLVGALLGGVAFFLLGWIMYGVLFDETLKSMMPGYASVARSEADLDLLAVIVGNLAFGFLFAYIFERWATISTFMGGLVAGAVIGFLMALGFDSIMHGTTTMGAWGGVLLDAVIFAIMGGLAGGVIGWWLGYNRK